MKPARFLKILPLCLLAFFSVAYAQHAPITLDSCNVTWTEFGADSQDSMPLGNGDIGLNVWTEKNGDILFYLSKTDAWNDVGELVKLARVRISLSPNPFAGGAAFSQTLKLRDSEIVITGGGTTVRIWADANAPVVRIEASSSQPETITATLDPWHMVKVNEVSADVVVPDEKDRLTWYHRNLRPGNPYLDNRTFGAVMEGAGLVRSDDRTLKSTAPQTHSTVAIYPLEEITPTLDEWLTKARTQADTLSTVDIEKARDDHQKWWQDFWDRSWIFVSGDADAQTVTQGYALQRFITACSGRGGDAIKFNGSIFVADNPDHISRLNGATVAAPMTADQRLCGGKYWFQNTRAMYWPRLMAGDYDLMQPLFRMYSAIVKSNAASVKNYYGHDGSYMAECAPFYGELTNLKLHPEPSYTNFYFTPVLELSAMMLDYYAYTGDKATTRDILIPMDAAALTFFDQHFSRDANGKLLLDPDNSIETFWQMRNPLPDIAGLHWVLSHLLALPDDLVDAATRKQWEKLEAELPEIPTGMRDGKKVLLAYEDGQPVAKAHNFENPELYAIYPFRFYGVGKPDLDVALNTFAIRTNKLTGCWCQDPVQAAMLGLTDLAKKDVTLNFSSKEPRLRFPAFWADAHDYAPDEDNGGNGENALQHMLMQCEGRRILLLPTWPKEWEADFKLHAPDQTTLEGHVKDGQITDLKVTPESRRADVVMPGTGP